MSDKSRGFWSSFPGILTGLAAVITAVTGLIIAVNGGNGSDVENPIKDDNTVISAVRVEGNNTNPVMVIETKPDSSTVTLEALLDCKRFPTKNTVTSLMSWSDYYHKQIVDTGASREACNKALAYRAQAHCKNRNDLAIRQGLTETLSQCKTIKFSWKDVQL